MVTTAPRTKMTVTVNFVDSFEIKLLDLLETVYELLPLDRGALH